MKKVLAVIALIVSILLLTGALLFLIAAMAVPERLLVAAALLVAGALPLIWGIRTFRRLAETSPAALATGAIALARRLGGEVTVAQMQAEYRISEGLALETLEKLRASGQAKAEHRQDRVVYVLGGLQPLLVSRRCPYCGSNFSVREALQQCPNCGASLQLGKE